MLKKYSKLLYAIGGLPISYLVTFYIFQFKDMKINIAIFIGTYLFFLYLYKYGKKFEDELENSFARNRNKKGLNRWSSNVNDTIDKLPK